MLGFTLAALLIYLVVWFLTVAATTWIVATVWKSVMREEPSTTRAAAPGERIAFPRK
jgi:hypothetical protein